MTYLHNLLTSTLRGIAQVCLQDSPFTGAFFLLAIALYSPIYAICALAGAMLSTAFAFKKAKEQCIKGSDVKNGLYGFNGCLIGIAIAAFLPINDWALLLLGLACIFSVQLVIWVAARSNVPLFTMPFIIVAMFVFGLGQAFNVAGQEVVPLFQHSFPLPIFESIGQIFLLPNAISGICILLGFLVAGVRAFFITLWAVGLAYFLAQEIGMNETALSTGLFGFCAVLTAHALCLPSTHQSAWDQSHFLPYKIILGVILSVLMTQVFILAHLSFFTLPFVLSVWAVQVLSKLSLSRMSKILNKSRI